MGGGWGQGGRWSGWTSHRSNCFTLSAAITTVCGSDMPTVPSVKHPAKIHVCGTFRCSALSHLHVVPMKMTINGEYYRSSTLANESMKAPNRTAQESSASERALMPHPIAMPCSCRTAYRLTTTKRPRSGAGRTSSPSRPNGLWPENSPDLNPIENF